MYRWSIILKQVCIYKDAVLIYKRSYGKIIPQEIIKTLIKDFYTEEIGSVHYRNYEKYRISYIIEKDFKVLFIFVNNKDDDSVFIQKELIRCNVEFFNLYKSNLDDPDEKINLTSFEPIIDSIQNRFPPIIAFIGYHGVGKTSIIDLLRTKEIPIQHEPKISGDIATLKIGRFYILLRDFTGQEDIGFLWNNFVKGSDAVIIVTDSNFSSVKRCKYFLKVINEEAPSANIATLVNKQDLINILKTSEIENILGVKTYPVTATTREKLIEITLEILDIKEEVSPILELLNKRQLLINEFGYAVNNINLEKAALVYQKLIDICAELGDNPSEMKFYRRYHEITNKLRSTNHIKEEFTSEISGLENEDSPVRISILEGLLKKLLSNYMIKVEGVISVVVSDRDGFVISLQSKKDPGDESVLGAIAATVDSFIERIKKEFGRESSFFNITTIHDKKFAYCSMGSKSILLTISELLTSDTELRVFSEHIAGKVELLLEGNINVSLEIPEIIKSLSKTKDGKIPTGTFALKLILTGDYGVGKTSLNLRFVQNIFKESYRSTVGVDISQKIMYLSENSKLKFIIWDIGGQIERMAPHRSRFYGGANAAFIVVDRTRPKSLNNVENWYGEIRRFIDKSVIIILIGNKSDLEDEIDVSEGDLKKIADLHGFKYILTSAKTGENVNEAFRYIAYRFLESV